MRLQWDPDHFPNGKSHPYRRAVQLGLKNISSFTNGADIVCIRDITEFVHEQAALVRKDDEKQLLVARERVYWPESAEARLAVNVSEIEQPSQKNES